jgi:hypothetical protein
MEGSMKTLSDLAAGFDDQAKANETMAEEILDRLDSAPEHFRQSRRWHADWLIAEAARLRARAAELRGDAWRRSSN